MAIIMYIDASAARAEYAQNHNYFSTYRSLEYAFWFAAPTFFSDAGTNG
jgi:hypothetical protein